MSTINVNIPTDYLRAAALFAPKADIRYYLIGVRLHVPAASETGTLTATCGHALAVLRMTGCRDINAEPLDAVDVILPLDFVKDACAKAKKAKTSVIRLAITSDTQTQPDGSEVTHTTITAPAFGLTAKPVDGRYPDARRVLPERVSGEIAQIDPMLLAKFGEARKILGSKYSAVRVLHNGKEPSVIDIDHSDFAGVCAPFRIGDDAETPAVLNARAGELHASIFSAVPMV